MAEQPDEGTITVVYSDSGRVRPGKTQPDVPILGYVITPEKPPQRQIDLDFRPATIGTHPNEQVRFFDIPATAIATETVSTATVAQVVELDSAFLKGADFFPIRIEELEGTRAGRGNGVYDCIAYGCALRRLDSKDFGGPITVRTDGELPAWMSGETKLTLDVNGRDIAPLLLSNLREMERPFGTVRHENYRGSANKADSGPLRELKRRIRHGSRR